MPGGKVEKKVIMANLNNSKNNEEKQLNDFRKLIQEIYEVVSKILNNSYLNPVTETMYEPDNFDRYVNEVKSFLNILVSSIVYFYEERPERLIVELRGKTFHQCLIEFFEKVNFILVTDSENRKVGLVELYKEVMQLQNFFYMYENTIRQEENTSELVKKLNDKLLYADHKLENLEAARLALLGQRTEEIYTNVSDNYLKRAHVYEALFYLIFIGAFLFTIIHLIYIDFESNKISYILVKLMTLTFVVTLGTIFLRKAAHLRKLNDQAHQTSLELRALPLFLKNVAPEHHSDIYKELAGKYFGKELDQTQNDKIGNLIQDQIHSSTELVKASAEMVKGLKAVSVSNEK